MNIIEAQNMIRGLPDEALSREMQSPSGSVPPFLILAELNRRKEMRESYQSALGDGGGTVAEEVVAAAGVPQGGIQTLAQMAPRTDLSRNDGVSVMGQPAGPAPMDAMEEMPLQRAEGGLVGRRVVFMGRSFIELPDGRMVLEETGAVAPPSLVRDMKSRGVYVSDAPDGMSAPPRRPVTLANGMAPLPEVAPVGPVTPPSQMVAPDNWPGASADPGPVPLEMYVPPEAMPPEPMAGGPMIPPSPDVAPDNWPRQEGGRSITINDHPFVVMPDGLVIDELTGKVAPEAIAAAVRAEAEKVNVDNMQGGEPAFGGGKSDGGGASGSWEPAPAASMIAPEAGESAVTSSTSDASAPAASSGPMSYEEFLRQRFEQLDKEREKEKWLSIAMAGAQILASDNPTLGGAIGEGLMAGLGHSAQSRKQLSDEEMALQEQMYKAQLARQALAARGSGRSGGGSSASSSRMFGSLPTSLADNFLKEYADLAEREAELDAMLRSGYMKSDYGYEPLDDGARAAIRSELENISNIKSRYSMMLGMPDIDLTQVAPNTTMPTQSTPALPKDR